MPIRALLFDLWGTLVYVDDPQYVDPLRAARVRLTLEALRGVGHPYPEETVTVALRTLGREHGTLHSQGRDIAVPEKVERFLNYLEPNLAQRVSPSTLRAVEEALVAPGRITPPFPVPGALEALQKAQARSLALGLISNTGLTPGYVLREVLADHGLLSFFQVLTFSDEARLAKPAAAIFHCTLEALGVQPADAVFVGDMPALDVAGPQAVGMYAVQVGDQQLDGVQPHARIDALPELFPALERLGLLAE
jgi:putative hydrolase of the HAD superfamily